MAEPSTVPPGPQPAEPAAAPPPVSPISPASPASALPGWPPALRLAFRLAFSYLVLYYFPHALSYVSYLPGVGRLAEAYFQLWQTLTLWAGHRLLHLREMPVDPDLGGDTTAGWVRWLVMAAVAVVAALAWTLLDRRRTEYRRLHAGLRLPLRYILGFTMFNYGMIKVIQSQFVVLHIAKLQETYGEMSPMGLLWTFMSYSAPYNVFTGGAEALGGLLLFFRRTTLLGALTVAAVMTHVVLINFSYDVIVKIYSIHLLATALFLAAPDLGRLADLLVLHRPTRPRVDLPWRSFPRWARFGRIAGKTLFIGYFLVTATRDRLELKRGIEERRARQRASFARTHPDRRFFLVDRGFHWIQEAPVDR